MTIIITEKKAKFENGSIKSEVTHQIDRDTFDKITNEDTIKFFRRLGGKERVSRSYTYLGYVPYKIVSTSPCGTYKTVREFDFKLA